MKTLIEILETSVKKHGANCPLTIGHLLNIVKLADKVEETRVIQLYDKESLDHSKLIEELEVESPG